jgi:osmotically-inducible protein OsmY
MKNVKLLVVLFCTLATLTAGCSTKKIRANPHTAADRRTMDMAEIDKDIETDIKENLRDDDEMRRFSHVNVTVYNGAVLLTGEAMNEVTKIKIVEMARIVKNVKMVHDNLIVDYPSDNLSRVTFSPKTKLHWTMKNVGFLRWVQNLNTTA